MSEIDLNAKTGRMLKKKRELMGLSQQEVGDYLGVTKSAISRWESGQISNMGRSHIKAISNLLQISPISIVMGEDYVKENKEDVLSASELIEYFKANKDKLSSLSKEDSLKLIKMIDIYLD